jgi:hypothetical protein
MALRMVTSTTSLATLEVSLISSGGTRRLTSRVVRSELSASHQQSLPTAGRPLLRLMATSLISVSSLLHPAHGKTSPKKFTWAGHTARILLWSLRTPALIAPLFQSAGRFALILILERIISPLLSTITLGLRTGKTTQPLVSPSAMLPCSLPTFTYCPRSWTRQSGSI